MQMNFNAEITTQRNRNQLFGLRREAERHAAMKALFMVEKRCRRFALPPQSKIFSRLHQYRFTGVTKGNYGDNHQK